MKSIILSAAHLTDDKIMSKMESGWFDLAFRQDYDVCVVKWCDKKAVLFCSAKLGVETHDKCKRSLKKDRKYIEIPKLIIRKEFNVNMSGVDSIGRIIGRISWQNS